MSDGSSIIIYLRFLMAGCDGVLSGGERLGVTELL